jgi:hypothetical protein
MLGLKNNSRRAHNPVKPHPPTVSSGMRTSDRQRCLIFHVTCKTSEPWSAGIGDVSAGLHVVEVHLGARHAPISLSLSLSLSLPGGLYTIYALHAVLRTLYTIHSQSLPDPRGRCARTRACTCACMRVFCITAVERSSNMMAREMFNIIKTGV